jgi:hypothetical protein
MKSALYFPHTKIRSESLLRTALLTWDSVECICPKDFMPRYENPLHQWAMDTIGKIRVPTEVEQLEVDGRVEQLIQSGVPETFRYSPPVLSDPSEYDRKVFELWPEKLGQYTWSKLEAAGLTGQRLSNGDYPASRAAGLTLMSILADVMAGETRARVTDQGSAYATIANFVNTPAGGDATVVDGDQREQVVALTLKVPDLTRVSLDRLIAFREREAEPDGHEYRALRHAYLQKVEDHVKKISEMDPRSADRARADEEFRESALDNIKDLKIELGFARNAAIFAKDVVALAVTGAGAGAAIAFAASVSIPGAITAAGIPAAIGGVMSALNKLAQDRRATLRKHPLAYLYELDRGLV